MIAPRYPIYVISKGRSDCCLTAKFLRRDRVPFRIVVEPQEQELYAKQFGADQLLVLPFSNLGLGGIPARNWVWEHAKASGAARHWILDDNIREVNRRLKGQRIRCDSGPAFAACEDFTDRYENVALAGMNYTMFTGIGMAGGVMPPPVRVNCHVYSCLLILNSLKQRWRGRYNEDTDLCLQVLAGGWCTLQFNAFLVLKVASMTMKGGNTTELYRGDGRLKMARALERMWPRVVSVSRLFRRPQHVVFNGWQRFDTPLRLRPGVKIPSTTNEYGLVLKAREPKKR